MKSEDEVGSVESEKRSGEQVLLTLLGLHPSDLESIKAAIASVQDLDYLDTEDREATNRVLVTAAAAGIPTELQVRAVADYCGLKISAPAPVVGSAVHHAPREHQHGGLVPQVPSRQAQEQQQQ